MQADLCLAVNYDDEKWTKTKELIEESADHEVGELLQMPLFIWASERCATSEQLNIERHRIVNRNSKLFKTIRDMKKRKK